VASGIVRLKGDDVSQKGFIVYMYDERICVDKGPHRRRWAKAILFVDSDHQKSFGMKSFDTL